MSGQLDIFAQAAADNSVPSSAWKRPKNAEGSWEEGYGPHATWKAFWDSLEPGEPIQVYRDSQGYRAHVHAQRDRVTGLWVGHCDEAGPTGSSCGIPTYRPAAYRSKEECVSAWSNTAFQMLEKRTKRDAEYTAWRARFDKEHQARRLALIQAELDADDNPETGEEGMAKRLAEHLEAGG